jgi:hypothetical protein
MSSAAAAKVLTDRAAFGDATIGLAEYLEVVTRVVRRWPRPLSLALDD